MNKRQLHYTWVMFRRVKPQYFLIIAFVSAVVAVLSLRANNQHMITLRDAVYSADKDNKDVQAPLKQLQSYVTSHMNTGLSTEGTAVYPPVQLKYTYNRLVQARSAATADANTKIYNDAQKTCEAQNSTDFSGRYRVPCIEDYVRTHQVTTAAAVPDALYKFAFVSPRWSPDVAGWSIVITVLAAGLAALAFAVDRWFKKRL